MQMLYKSIFLTGLLVTLPFTQSVSAQSAAEIQEYCQSMTGSGMSDEDVKQFMSDCVAEQSSYLEPESPSEYYEDSPNYEENTSYDDNNSYENSYQEPQYEQEDYGQEQNCYSKVDEHIQKLLDNDPNIEFDYDQLVEQCLNGKL